MEAQILYEALHEADNEELHVIIISRIGSNSVSLTWNI